MKVHTQIPNVAIIGGGITGLSACYYLDKISKQRKKPVNWSLYESSGRIGGKIRTVKQNGFLIEEGADSFVSFLPWAVTLCRELGLENELIAPRPSDNPVWVYRKGLSHPFPKGIFFSPPLNLHEIASSKLLSERGKKRLLKEESIPARKRTRDESLSQFIRRRMGTEVLTRMAGPLLSGIHASDSEKLSMLSTYPHMEEMEQKYGSLFKVYKNMKPATSSAFLSIKSGIGSLTDRIADLLTSEKINLYRKISMIEFKDGKYHVKGLNMKSGKAFVLKTDGVILAIPSNEAGEITRPVNKSLSDKLLHNLRSVSTVNVYMAYHYSPLLEKHLKGNGLLISHDENITITALSWSSKKYEYRAPSNSILIRAFLGRDGRDSVVNYSDCEIQDVLKREIPLFLPKNVNPVFSKIIRQHNSFPQYDVGHASRIKDILSDCPAGLFLAGSPYGGVGIPSCIKQGKIAAERMFDYAFRN